jgi:hypothetical protein
VGLFKREPLPDSVTQSLDLIPGERVLAFGTDPLGRYVIATTEGLHLQRRPPAYSRLDWSAIRHASFDSLALRLDVDQRNGEGAAATTATTALKVPLLDQGELPQVVRDRIMASIALQQHVALRGRLGVTVAARRQPHSDALQWGISYDQGLDPSDPQLAAEAADALTRVRADSGLS